MQTTHGAFTKMFLKPLRSAIFGLSFTTAWVIESMSAGESITLISYFFSEQSNKYFDSWTSLVGADGYTPIAGSPLLGAASFNGWTGFDTVSYIGAFDGSNNWMSGWTNFDPQNAKY